MKDTKDSKRVSGPVMVLCLFLLSWPLIGCAAWTYAHEYAANVVMPWLMQVINQSGEVATYALGTGLAVAGSFVAAILVFVLLLLVSIGWYRLKSAFTKTR